MSSADPLLFGLSNAKTAPFTFTVFTDTLSVLVIAIYLYFNYPLDKHKTAIKLISTKYWKHTTLIFATVGSFDNAAFAFALNYVDITIVTIIHQLWVVFIIIGLHFYNKKRHTHAELGLKQWGLMATAFFGVALAIASQTPNNGISMLDALGNSASFALLLALLCPVLAAVTVLGTLIGGDIITAENNKTQSTNHEPDYIYFTLIFFALKQFYTVPIAVAAALVTQESPSALVFMPTLICGAIVIPIAGMMFRVANCLTTSFAINAIFYLMPIFAVGWLALFGLSNISKLHYLITGLIIIVICNIYLNKDIQTPAKASEALKKGILPSGSLDTTADKL